jgi:hypothetical protein
MSKQKMELADRIEQAKKQHEYDRREVTYKSLSHVLVSGADLIVSALRCSAESVQPVTFQTRWKSTTTGEWSDWQFSKSDEQFFRHKFSDLIEAGKCEIRHLFAGVRNEPQAAPDMSAVKDARENLMKGILLLKAMDHVRVPIELHKAAHALRYALERSQAGSDDPVSFTPISGPGVDALHQRKESDNGPSEEEVNRDLKQYLALSRPQCNEVKS